jgi:hypothetical protein
MQEDLIKKIANLMTEQAAAFVSLESLTKQLISALIRSEPTGIESLSRAGETELMRMRARLLEITNSLTTFSEINRQENYKSTISSESRELFESAANFLLEAARNYRQTSNRAQNLALGGSSFAAACIEFCGVPPSTYNAPVMKSNTGATR